MQQIELKAQRLHDVILYDDICSPPLSPLNNDHYLCTGHCEKESNRLNDQQMRTESRCDSESEGFKLSASVLVRLYSPTVS